MCNFKNYLISQ